MSLSLGLGLGLTKNSGGGAINNAFNTYTLNFNGTDEYLSRALPTNLLTGNQNNFTSAGSRPTGWGTGSGETWNQTGITGSTSTNVLKLASAGYAFYTGLTVGQKYKVKSRWYGNSSLSIGSSQYLSDYYSSEPTAQWNALEFTFIATTINIYFSADSAEIYLDYFNFTPDWKLDLNESFELIKHSNNRDFADTAIDYATNGNHTASHSTADKIGASGGSLLISASGAGSSGSNYVSLPSAQMETLVSGNKYTQEFFAKVDPSSLSYGSELFSSAVNSGTDPFETFSASGNDITSAINTTNLGAISIDIGNISSGDIIKVTFDLTLNSGALPRISLRNGALTATKSGSNTLYFVATSALSPAYIDIREPSSTVTNFTMTDIVIKKATTITLTAQLETKSVTITPSISAFTKGVLNFEATPSEVGQDLKFYLNGAGNVYVDNVSLTQAYDVVRAYTIKPAVTEKRAILSHSSTNFTELKANGYMKATVSDGTNTVTNEALTQYATTPYQLFIQTLNRTDKLYLTKDGVTDAGVTATTLGKVIQSGKLNLGANSSNAELFSGLMGAMIFIRFTKIDGNFTATTYKIGQTITGGGAEVVLYLDPRLGSSTTAMLQDYSGKGNAPTAVNMDTTNRQRITT